MTVSGGPWVFMYKDMLVQFSDAVRIVVGEHVLTDRNGKFYLKTRALTPVEALKQKLDPREPEIDTCGVPSKTRVYFSDIHHL